MDYRILGPLEALDGERRLSLGGTRQRAVLALLLLHGNKALARDMIIDELWGESPPQTAHKVLQNCISALRKELPGGPETLGTAGAAYVLRLEPDELDRDRFERGLADGRAAYRDARRTLLDELGIAPGRALQELERAILAQDAALDTAPAARASAPGRRAATPVVGRDEELALLEAGLEDALAGRGRLF